MITHLSVTPPALLLGTAMWGWTTPKETAFALLDEWYARGFREVDGATNYPIDKDPNHFRKAEKILLAWIKAHGVSDLEVMMKIGSVNNLRTPEQVLTRSFILMMLDEYRWLFGNNLRTLMVHWDNRDDASAVRETMEGLDVVRQQGLRIGLSGIRHPEVYAGLNRDFDFDFCIQIKHNVLQSDYERYAQFQGRRRFIAYGINAGGLKLDPEAYSAQSSLAARGADIGSEPPIVENIRRIIAQANEESSSHKKHRPPLSAMHEIGIIHAFYHPDILGILLGVSSVSQLRSSIDFYEILKQQDFSDVFQKLKTPQPHNPPKPQNQKTIKP